LDGGYTTKGFKMSKAYLRRRQKILHYLQDTPEASVSELVKLCAVSPATVRRDLLEMKSEGLLVRTFGGARCATQQSLLLRTFEQRSMLQHKQKMAIAAAAAELIEPGMTIAIDSGTTCWHFSAQLKQQEKWPLRIVTSALAVIETLGSVEGMEIHLIGGRFRVSNLDFCGPMSASGFSNFHVDAAILGCDAFTPQNGAFSLDLDSVAISQAMIQCSDKRILLCDDSKIGKKSGYRLLALPELDCLVTNRAIKTLAQAPYQVIIAK